MPTAPDAFEHSDLALGSLPGVPFRGALPTIRFATGSVFVILGLAAVTGLSTGQHWLAQGAEHWVPMDMAGALVFLLFGAIMMISRSNIAREASWVLMLAIGLASFAQHYAAGWPAALDAGTGEPGPWLRPVPAFLFVITGLRIYAATRRAALAPLLDGVILGLAVPALLGYLTGFAPLYESSVFRGISAIEAIGFSALGALFLLADIEYARLDMRAWKLPAAIGVSALAATTSIRVTEAVLDSFGRSGLQGIVSGSFSPEVSALAATNLLMALSIGAAAMFLLISRDTTQIARRESDARRLSQADFARTGTQLAETYDASAATAARLHEEVSRPLAELARSVERLGAELDSGRTGAAGETAQGIGREARRMARRTADLGCFDPARPEDFAPGPLAFQDMIAAVIALNRPRIRARRNRVLTEHADGVVHADRTRLQLALHLMLGHALDATRDCTPLISVRLDRAEGETILRMCFSAGCGDEVRPEPAFALVRQIAAWHGGSFDSTQAGRSRIMELRLPAAA